VAVGCTQVGDVVVTLMEWLCQQLRRPPAGARGVGPAVWALATLLKERRLRGRCAFGLRSNGGLGLSETGSAPLLGMC
jgi:hypothetical protein